MIRTDVYGEKKCSKRDRGSLDVLRFPLTYIRSLLTEVFPTLNTAAIPAEPIRCVVYRQRGAPKFSTSTFDENVIATSLPRHSIEMGKKQIIIIIMIVKTPLTAQ